MSQNLLHRSANRIQLPVSQFLVELKGGDRELAEQLNELVFELNRISSQFLLRVLPLLEQELRVDELEMRRAVVELLARLFASRESQLASGYHVLFNAFLARFNDRDSEIRAVMVEFSKHFLLAHQIDVQQINGKLLSFFSCLLLFVVCCVCCVCFGDLAIVFVFLLLLFSCCLFSNYVFLFLYLFLLIEHLLNRMRDTEERIRLAAVIAIGEIASSHPERVLSTVVVALGERMRDRKASKSKIKTKTTTTQKQQTSQHQIIKKQD